MSDAAKWYVVHTYSGYENKVASSIEKAVENRKLHDSLAQEENLRVEALKRIDALLHRIQEHDSVE